MSSEWAAENLQVIRILMERSALYRRALAPIMMLLGALGSIAAALPHLYRIANDSGFAQYWLIVCVVGGILSLLLVRRQAFREAEPFWSPPTRRVAQAALPAVFVGLVAAIWGMESDSQLPIGYLPPIWMALYGCALNAAGFFMPRGMKLFGWLFIAASCGAGVYLHSSGPASIMTAHKMMGATFGGLHVIYGVYLLFTEPRMEEP